jgi:deoxyribodipyrimidine photo-lyase
METLFGKLEPQLNTRFTTDYQQILKKIEAVNPIKYASSRNYLNGAVTYLSPYISRGVISLVQVKEIVLAKGYKAYEIEKFLQELAWREYYQRVWQHKQNAIWQDLKHAQTDVHQAQLPLAIVEATTGIQSIDKAISVLEETGYMHNHARMYLASIVCNIAKTRWEAGAKWLYYHLLDGDIASNNCSWQWVAGAFASKKYYCNQENINKYTFSKQSGTFLDCEYENLYNMDIPAGLQEPWTFNLQTILPQTPTPLLDINKPTLIYTANNLDPMWRKNEDVNRILLLEPSHYSAYPVCQKVLDFTIALSKNIEGIQVFVGEYKEIVSLCTVNSLTKDDAIIFKEHPSNNHFRGKQDSREWMYPNVTGYYPSFFGFWNKCKK